MERRPPPPEGHAGGRALLVRDRLLDRLRARWLAPVTVVVAPAGYVKSSLLTQAMAANAVAPVGIERFVTCWPGMSAASSLGEALCRALDVTSVPAGRRGVEEFTGAVVEGIWRLSPQQVVVMVDDVHEVPEGADATHLLQAVTAALPANGHLVLAGRRAPPVTLARLEVEGRVARLDAADLAFTDAEVGAFAEIRGVSAAIVGACGGWPAMAELLASTGGRDAGIESPSVARDYVGQEVLANLTPETRHALGVLAHLGPFDHELAREALGRDVEVASLLGGLPLVGTTSEGEWQVHGLWQSLLGRDVTAADVADATRRAGLALLRRGRVGAAVLRLIDAEAWEDVPHAVVGAMSVVHPPVARDVAAGWFQRFPPGVRTHPAGRLLAAVATAESDPVSARREYEACRVEFHALGDRAGEIAALVQLAELAWWSEDQDALAEAAMRGFELEAAGCEEVVPLACLARGLLYDMANDSRRMLAELERIQPGSLNDAWMGIARWMRAIALLELGHAPEAVTAADEALAHAELLHAPLAETTRLQALWYQGRSAEVLDRLPDLVGSIKESGYHNHTALVASQCAVVHALLGHSATADAYLAQARVAATGIADAPLIDANLSVAAAAAALVGGDETTAAATLTAYARRHPLRDGIAAAPQQRHVALFYLLVPSSRQTWDGADLGPLWAYGRSLARAVVAARSGHDLPADLPSLDDPAPIQAHLPPSWVAELAVAAVAAGRDDGRRLLDRTWTSTRATVARLAGTGRAQLRTVAQEVLKELPVRPTRRLELRLLGPFELRDDQGLVRHPDLRRERVRLLLAYLVLRPTVSRAQLAADLWPERDPEARSRNLRVTLSYVLRVLEPGRDQRAPSFFLRQHGGNLSLHAEDRLVVDVWDFDAACERAEAADRQGAPAVALAHALQAVDLWRGGADELASEPWAIAHVEERQVRFAALAVRAGELLLAMGNTARAQELAERALVVDPWLDGAHRLVVAGHHIEGNNLAAQQALRRYRAAIHDLGLDVDDATLMVERLVGSLPTQPVVASGSRRNAG